MKKITKATFKSFIKRNAGNLHISNLRSFDGMIDGLSESADKSFSPVETTPENVDHTLGILGAWFVGQSRDYFSAFKADGFEGITVYNCCGSFIVAVKA